MSIVQYLNGAAGTTQTFPSVANVDKLYVIGSDEGRWHAPSVLHDFSGVSGVRQLLDYRKHRQLSVDVQLLDYASAAALNTDHAAIEGFVHNLRGNLSIDGTVYPDCTFESVEPLARRQFDGSGRHGWTRKLRLIWKQRSYT